MNLLDNYVAEVGQHLPKKIRADIEAEIHSLLEDTLEDRSQAAGREPDEEMTIEVLKEFGSPEKVAASYLPEKYLIGPQLFPAFWLTMRIVLTIVVVFALIGIGAALSRSGPTFNDFVQTAFDGLLGFASSAVQVFGNIVLIFAILQWALPGLKVKINEEKWDPRTLKTKVPADRIQVAGLLAEIGFTIAAIMLFNFYPQYVGFGSFSNGNWTFVSVLTPAFFNYLPWIDQVWFLTITLDIILLRQGRWQPWIRWFSVGKSVLVIGVLKFMIFSGPPIANLTTADVTRLGWPHSLDQFLPQLNMNVRLLLWLIILLESIELVKKLYYLLWKKQVELKR